MNKFLCQAVQKPNVKFVIASAIYENCWSKLIVNGAELMEFFFGDVVELVIVYSDVT